MSDPREIEFAADCDCGHTISYKAPYTDEFVKTTIIRVRCAGCSDITVAEKQTEIKEVRT